MNELIQGSQEWILARVGSLGASRVHDAIARTKTGFGASRPNLMAELLCERLTGQPAEKFTNGAMVWGTEKEPEARDAYAWRMDCEVTQVGLIKHPTIIGSHASPDGLVGSNGMVEIKAPNSATHLETLLSGTVPAKYVTQMMWQLTCGGRDWCDFVSYDPRLPDNMRLFVKRIDRDDKLIAELETMVTDFLAELDAKITALTAKYGQAA